MSKSMPLKHFLREHIQVALKQYFHTLEDENCQGLYALFLSEVEMPLLKMMMQHTKGNQSRAAACLGISRSTLKKLLIQYGLEP
jgi:Fis family transcriptional regulator, factor for inversion stimulation protein